MFDTHESLAVRHTGQLIDQRMSDFIVELMELLFDLPSEDERRNTPWFNLLSVGSSDWKQTDLDACYLYVLTHHWLQHNIKPPPEVMYQYHYGPLPEEYDGENKLKHWCESDDRHITFDEAFLWSDSEECQDMIATYLKDSAEQSATQQYYLDNEDIFGNSNTSTDVTISDLAYNELGSLKNKWRFIAEQIKYVDTLAPDVTISTKLYWLKIALVSQPVTEIFGKKKSYEVAILREKELIKLLPNEHTTQ